MVKNIFCDKCKFYLNDPRFKYPNGKNTGSDIHTVCNNPKNIDGGCGPHDPNRYIKSPSIINRNHDCNWFSLCSKKNTYVWDSENRGRYDDHGDGTFNINPQGGVDGVFIGNKNLGDIIDERCHASEDIESRIEEVESKIDDVLYYVEKVDGTLVAITREMAETQRALNEQQNRLDGIDDDMDAIYTHLSYTDGRLSEMQAEIDSWGQGIIPDGIDGGDSHEFIRT